MVPIIKNVPHVQLSQTAWRYLTLNYTETVPSRSGKGRPTPATAGHLAFARYLICQLTVNTEWMTYNIGWL